MEWWQITIMAIIPCVCGFVGGVRFSRRDSEQAFVDGFLEATVQAEQMLESKGPKKLARALRGYIEFRDGVLEDDNDPQL